MKFKEYRQIIKYACGHTIETVTLNYKLSKEEIERLKTLDCPECRYLKILKGE